MLRARLHGRRAGRGAARCGAELLARLGLKTQTHHYPARLDASQCQRVAIARALVTGAAPGGGRRGRPRGSTAAASAWSWTCSPRTSATTAPPSCISTRDQRQISRATRTLQLNEGRLASAASDARPQDAAGAGMSPHRLALRTLMLARPRSVLAVLLIAACLCLLDLFAGNIASVRARLEYQAVTGERLGHLSITRAGATRAAPRSSRPRRSSVKRLVEAVAGVALVVPQMRVSGIASTGQRSALFHGEGIGSAGTARGAEPDPHGKLNPAQPNGIALSSGHARSLGLRPGSNVTLTGVTRRRAGRAAEGRGGRYLQHRRIQRQRALAADAVRNGADPARHRAHRALVVYLADPKQLDAVRAALLRRAARRRPGGRRPHLAGTVAQLYARRAARPT